jgi:hypothetical protein
MPAGAITNRPFLKDLPPIEVSMKEYPQLLEAVALSESKRLMDPQQVHVTADINSKELTNMAFKTLTFKKLTDGENKGKVGAFADTEMVGLCDKAAMKAYMAEDPDDASAAELAERARVQMNETQVACFSELSKAGDGAAVTRLTERFVEEGKFDTRALIKAQKVERLVAGAIQSGKFLGTQRQYLFEAATANYDATAKLVELARPVVDTKNHGLNDDGATASADQKLEATIKTYMTEHKADYPSALKAVSKEHPELYAAATGK